MPTGNIEGYYQVVRETILKKVVGTKTVQDYLDKLELLKRKPLLKIGDATIHDELNGDGYGDIDPDSKEWLAFKKAYDKVCDTFKKKTGLDIYAMYTEGNGDAYDDLASYRWYWVIPGHEVWIRKPTKKAAEFMKKYGDCAIDLDQRFSIYG